MVLRRPLAAVTAALLMLTGCGQSHRDHTAQPVTDGFTCKTAIRYNEMDLQGRLTRDADGKLTLSFSLPKTLEGVAIGWNGTDMTMELGGMSIAVPTESVPQGALIRRLLQVLSADHGDGQVMDEGYVFAGDIDGQAYTLVCDPDTGLPETLSLPSEELEVAFTEAALTTNNKQ